MGTHTWQTARLILYLTAMSILDELKFEPDEELRLVLIDHERAKEASESDRGPRDLHDTVAYAAKYTQDIRHRIKLTNLSEIRNVKLMTQTELAQKAGTTRRTITAIENGLNEPSVFLALTIAEALDVKIEEIFYVKPPQIPSHDFDKHRWAVVSKTKKR